MTITVNPPAAGMVTVAGTIRYQRVPFNQNTSLGLNYAAQSMSPARGIVVRALSGNTQTVLASGVTNDNGGYSLTVAANTSIRIQAVAQMAREAPLALPHWNFRAMDNEAATPTPYTFADALPFDSSTAGAHDLAISSGFNNSGNVTGTRASAPFAVLDTIYLAMQTILSVAPNTNFPPLILDWAVDNPGGETYYESDA